MNTTLIENDEGIVYIVALQDVHIYTIGVSRKEDGWSYHITIGNMEITGNKYVGKESAFASAKLMVEVIMENLDY